MAKKIGFDANYSPKQANFIEFGVGKRQKVPFFKFNNFICTEATSLKFSAVKIYIEFSRKNENLKVSEFS